METCFITLFTSPHQNGFLLFILGVIFILSLYHFLLYFQQKNKSYLYYSLYTFLLLIAYVIYPENSFINIIPSKGISFLKLTHQFWVWVYNIIYFYFVLYFLNFQKHYPKQNKILLMLLISLFFIGIALFTYTVITHTNELLNFIYTTYYTKVIVLITLWGFYLTAKVKEDT